MLPQNVEPSKCEYEFAVSENVLWDGFFGIQVDFTLTSKRYYWLKLKDDFFSSIKIKKLRKTGNGSLLTIIYLKMQLLSVKNGGVLLFEGVESSFEEELALALDENIDSVRATLLYLQNQGMLQRMDGNRYLMPDVVRNVGSESDSAARMRKLRGKDMGRKRNTVTL